MGETSRVTWPQAVRDGERARARARLRESARVGDLCEGRSLSDSETKDLLQDYPVARHVDLEATTGAQSVHPAACGPGWPGARGVVLLHVVLPSRRRVP